MDTKTSCPNCGQHILVDSTAIGQQAACPTCSMPFTITPVSLAVPPSLPPPPIRKGNFRALWVVAAGVACVIAAAAGIWFLSGGKNRQASPSAPTTGGRIAASAANAPKSQDVKSTQPNVGPGTSSVEGVLWVEGEKSKPRNLWFLPANSNTPRLLARDAGIWRVNRSPDKKKIAYSGFTTNELSSSFFGFGLEGPCRIVDTAGKSLFSTKDATEDIGSFSPDSTYYTFGREEPKLTNSNIQRYTLCVFDLQRSEEHLVAKGVFGVQWVPNSTGLLYQTSDSHFDLFHVPNARSGEPEQILTNLSSYQLSPSNNWVYVTAEPDKGPGSKSHWLYNISTRHYIDLVATARQKRLPGQARLTNNPDITETHWSQDGRRFAYLAEMSPVVFDCETEKAIVWTNEGVAEGIEFSRNSDRIGFTFTPPKAGGRVHKAGIIDCPSGKQCDFDLPEGAKRLLGWIGEELAVTDWNTVFLVGPDRPFLTLMDAAKPFEIWRESPPEGVTIVKSEKEAFRVFEVGKGGAVTEPFPAIGSFSIDFADAGMVTVFDLGLEGLRTCSPRFYRTKTEFLGYSTQTTYIQDDLRFAMVPALELQTIVVSVKEKGKPCAQYLLHRGNPVPEKIGELNGAVPMWVEGQERIMFRVVDMKTETQSLHLYDIRSKKWSKLTDTMAPVLSFVMSFMNTDLWSF